LAAGGWIWPPCRCEVIGSSRPRRLSEPTIERTWLCRKERAAARFDQLADTADERSSVRNGLSAWHCAGGK
jgi:hypothetical protein